MLTKKRKRSETAQRVYTLLKNNPDLTTNEICRRLSDLSGSAVQTAISRMFISGELESRGKEYLPSADGKMLPHKTYHVKYKVRPSRNSTKPKKPSKQPAPKVMQPKLVVDTQPVWNPAQTKPEPEGPTTPTAEREVLVLRHLSDIYKALNLMTEQQDALIEVFKGTLADLAETKNELEMTQLRLEAEQGRRNWWDAVKGWFS